MTNGNIYPINYWYKRLRHALELSVADMQAIIAHGQAASRGAPTLKAPSKSRIRAWALAIDDKDYRTMSAEEFDWFTKGLTPFFEEMDGEPCATMEELDASDAESGR